MTNQLFNQQASQILFSLDNEYMYYESFLDFWGTYQTWRTARKHWHDCSSHLFE